MTRRPRSARIRSAVRRRRRRGHIDALPPRWAAAWALRATRNSEERAGSVRGSAPLATERAPKAATSPAALDPNPSLRP